MNDTIAAIATPLGEGGIGIVRISGPRAIAVADEVFESVRGISLQLSPSHRIYYGWIKSPQDGRIIDEVLVTVMRAPRTFTREDVVEINCHGGIKPLEQVLQLVCNFDGVRLADPGEFTKRAFLNGRIDLAQAEAVIDVIRSKTDRALEVSLNNLQGRLSRKIEELRGELLAIRGKIEVSIDYPEYDEPESTREELRAGIEAVKAQLERLIASSRSGRILRDGLKTVIVGKPNVGKSSLLNALLGVDRAIVTDVPGTTRDTVEELCSLGNIPLNIIDTAGIREAADIVEKIGIERTQKAINEADLVLFVVDSSRNIDNEDRQIASSVKDKQVVVVLNKRDLPQAISPETVKSELGIELVVSVSATEGQGLDELEKLIRDLFMSGQVMRGEEAVVTNMRHVGLLRKSNAALEQALSSLAAGFPVDMIAIDVGSAWESLGLIIGQAVDEDLVDHIFAQFCLGK